MWRRGSMDRALGFEPKGCGFESHRRRLFRECVAGVKVSIAAFQAVDPGSIPGQRSPLFGKQSQKPA